MHIKYIISIILGSDKNMYLYNIFYSFIHSYYGMGGGGDFDIMAEDLWLKRRRAAYAADCKSGSSRCIQTS